MRISRIVIASGTAPPRTFAFDPKVATVFESPADAERLLAALRNLYLGTKRNCQIFATIDGVEFEITNDMAPLIGQRLNREFGVVDLAVPAPMTADPTDIRDVQSVVARAALETIGTLPATLDLSRIDQASTAVERHIKPLASDAHAAYLKRTGLLQLFSRRNGRKALDLADPTVKQLTSFEQVLTDRRRQVSSSSPPTPREINHATDTLRILMSARMGGIPPSMASSMSPEAVEREVAQWVTRQHDRQLSPVLAELCSRHARGVDVLGSIPIVIDLRRVEGLPPGGDSMRWASRQHGDQLQFIMLVADKDKCRWVERAFDASQASG